MFIRWSIGFAALALLSGCNLFSALDGPSGDAQLLSAARGCLDRGDYQCAMNDYGKLSTADSDLKLSGEAYTILVQEGAGMGPFMDFVGNIANKSLGHAVTQFAESLVPGAGVNKRVAIWTAYKNEAQIANPYLQGLVQFIGATALASELLAEEANSSGVLTQASIAANPAACAADSLLTCGVDGACDVGTDSVSQLQVNSTANSITGSSPPDDTNSPSLQQLFDAISQAVTGLTNVGASGKFTSVVSGFTSLQSGSSPTTAPTARCFRMLLLQQGIGE